MSQTDWKPEATQNQLDMPHSQSIRCTTNRRQRYIVCLIDFTVMPANAKQVITSVNVLSAILGMGSGNLGHVQLPVFQKQVKEATVLSHRRNLDELMLKANLSIAQEIVLFFDKCDCNSTDVRNNHQVCVAAFHKQFTSSFASSSAFQKSQIGPLRLLPVSEFYGYNDESAKPGPAERAETKLSSK